MNVLKPELIWVDDRCYRVLENTKRTDDVRQISPYVEDNDQMDYKDSEDESYDSDIEIVPFRSTRFSHSFCVPKPYFPFIIGSKNVVRKKLETETRTSIIVPALGQDGDIVIIGSDQKGITTARRRINLLVEAARKKLQFTHFLSIPLNEGQIIMKFNMFKTGVLGNSGKIAKGVEESLFQIPSKLHLTIGALLLLDNAERKQAVEALDYCKEHIVMPVVEKYGSIPIRLRGTEIMNDDPSETRVLYAVVEEDENRPLHTIAEEIRNHFADIGLLQEKRLEVKLHLTLMNTQFKLDDEDKQRKDLNKDVTFDAREILKEHGDTFFGETTLKQIHISQRHTISNNGYYQATAKMNLLD